MRSHPSFRSTLFAGLLTFGGSAGLLVLGSSAGLVVIGSSAGLLVLGSSAASAQTANTPQQLQAMITNGQQDAALSQLKTIVAAHPNSGVAWYLVAEAEDARGNEAAARGALGKADQVAPGLPFAQPSEVAALRNHLSQPAPVAAAGSPTGRGISPMVMLIGGLVVLFFLYRMFSRRRQMAGGYPAGYRPGPPMNPGASYGPGGMPYGPGGGVGMGGGIGSSLIGGLAAGAGLAAGERLIDGAMGGNNNAGFGQGGASEPEPTPERDDGLNGNPGWDDNGGGGGGGGGGFDPGNNW